MSEEIKFDLDKDIIMQIEMDSYVKYNDTIASMNDHLGEIYGYSDVKDMEESQLHYEKKLAYKAIKDLQQKVEQLEKEKNTLMYSLTLVRQKWNNDKARYRRKAKVYREQRNQLENIRKEAIDFVNDNKNKTIAPYGDNEDTDYEVCLFEEDINHLLNILNKGSE